MSSRISDWFRSPSSFVRCFHAYDDSLLWLHWMAYQISYVILPWLLINSIHLVKFVTPSSWCVSMPLKVACWSQWRRIMPRLIVETYLKWMARPRGLWDEFSQQPIRRKPEPRVFPPKWKSLRCRMNQLFWNELTYLPTPLHSFLFLAGDFCRHTYDSGARKSALIGRFVLSWCSCRKIACYLLQTSRYNIL